MSVKQDQVTEALLNNAYTKIDIFFEYRDPGLFISYIKRRNVWYWGFGLKLVSAMSRMLETLEHGQILGDTSLIQPNVDPFSGYLIDSESGDKIPDPLTIEMKSRHKKIIKITLSCKDYKYIAAETISNDSRKYSATGDTAIKAVENLFISINAQDVNLKKSLPCI